MVIPGLWLSLLFGSIQLVSGARQCYYGKGQEFLGPNNLVPCYGDDDTEAPCCLLGDKCFSGNTCINEATGNVYQYGCTDVNYESDVCPYKCGFDPRLSPWTALNYCEDKEETWVCQSPESCGCKWNATYDMLDLDTRSCQAMGSEARIAMYAPATLIPYVLLPTSSGGSTGYFLPHVTSSGSWTQWTVQAGYTAANVTQFVPSYTDTPTTIVLAEAGVTPDGSTYSAASPTASGATPATVTLITSTATSTPSPSSTKPSTLSTGAKAGIGVGVALGVCLIAALLIFYLFHLKRKNRKQPLQLGHALSTQSTSQTPQPRSEHVDSTKPPYYAQNWHSAYPYHTSNPSLPYPETSTMWVPVQVPKMQPEPQPMELSAERNVVEMGDERDGYTADKVEGGMIHGK